jgi:hypothetical protein
VWLWHCINEERHVWFVSSNRALCAALVTEVNAEMAILDGVFVVGW